MTEDQKRTESDEWAFLDRMKRDELPKMPRAVAEVIDEFNMRQHGIMSGSHGAGLFLDLLRDRGFCVEMERRATHIAADALRAYADGAHPHAVGHARRVEYGTGVEYDTECGGCGSSWNDDEGGCTERVELIRAANALVAIAMPLELLATVNMDSGGTGQPLCPGCIGGRLHPYVVTIATDYGIGHGWHGAHFLKGFVGVCVGNRDHLRAKAKLYAEIGEPYEPEDESPPCGFSMPLTPGRHGA